MENIIWYNTFVSVYTIFCLFPYLYWKPYNCDYIWRCFIWFWYWNEFCCRCFDRWNWYYRKNYSIKVQNYSYRKIAFVITDNGEEISETLVSTSPRGVTLIDVKGVYTNTKKNMLFCALKENETEAFQRKILSIDRNAFIVFSESQSIKGNGFYLYK